MSSADELFEKADRLEEEGHEESALKAWRELAVLRPDDAGVFCRLAGLARELGYKDEAASAFGRAIQLGSELSVAYVGLGSMAIDDGDSQRAADFLQKAVQIEKTEYGYCMLGVALRDLGKKEEAAASFWQALEIDPDFDEAYFNLGLLTEDTNPSEAKGFFSKALTCTPDYADAHRELGWLLRKDNPGPEAEYHIRRAIELDPEDAWARIYLGNLLWARAEILPAMAEFEKAAEIAPDCGFPFWSQANVYEDQESWDEAQALYEHALDLEPDDAVANMNFGRMLKRKGDSHLARKYLERALFLNPEYEAARNLLDELT